MPTRMEGTTVGPIRVMLAEAAAHTGSGLLREADPDPRRLWSTTRPHIGSRQRGTDHDHPHHAGLHEAPAGIIIASSPAPYTSAAIMTAVKTFEWLTATAVSAGFGMHGDLPARRRPAHILDGAVR